MNAKEYTTIGESIHNIGLNLKRLDEVVYYAPQEQQENLKKGIHQMSECLLTLIYTFSNVLLDPEDQL
jgi:hypothetical protein